MNPLTSILTDAYRYGFNGQEKDDEIAGAGNSYTAMFWQYDPRLGRRWNLDPKPNPSISQYATFANNPIWYSDPLGDTIFIYNMSADFSAYGFLGHTAIGISTTYEYGLTGANGILYLPASGNNADWRTVYVDVPDGSGRAIEYRYIDEAATVKIYQEGGDLVQRLKISLPKEVESVAFDLIHGYQKNNNARGAWCTAQVKNLLIDAYMGAGYNEEDAINEVDKLIPYSLPEILEDKAIEDAGYEGVDYFHPVTETIIE